MALPKQSAITVVADLSEIENVLKARIAALEAEVHHYREHGHPYSVKFRACEAPECRAARPSLIPPARLSGAEPEQRSEQ